MRIYTGIVGQIGDIVMFTATARRIKELFPTSTLTFAVSRRYREAGELVAGLPYVDRLFVTELYFEKLTPELFQPWERGWPVDLRGDDEVAEQRRHHLVFETRPRHVRERWWEHAHQVEETARMAGVPGPVDCRTEIAIPPGTRVPHGAEGKIVLHNEPAIDPCKAWPWESVRELVRRLGPENCVLLGSLKTPPYRPAAHHSPLTTHELLDLRARTTLAEAAAIIRASRCYVGIDSGLMWIGGSLQVPAVGLYGTTYRPAYGAIRPVNPNAVYLQAEGGLERIGVGEVLTAVERVLVDGGHAGSVRSRHAAGLH